MPATLNLDFTSLQIFDSPKDITPSIQSGDGGEGLNFTDILKIRVDATLDAVTTHGEHLPDGGNVLPPLTDLLPGDLPRLADLPPLVNLPSDTTAELLPNAPSENEGAVDIAATWPSAPGMLVDSDPLPALREALPQPITLSNSGHPVSPTEAAPAPLPLHETLSGGRYPVQQPAPELVTGSIPGLNADITASVAATPVAQVVQRDTVRQAPVVEATATIFEDADEVLSQQRLREPVGARVASTTPADALFDRVNILPAQANPSSQIAASPIQGLATAGNPQVGSELSFTQVTDQARLAINTPVNDPAWGERISEKVLILAGNQNRSAEIRLTPAELGPIRVSVAVDDGVANVTFNAQNVVAREAIEQAMPRLREFLAENGLTLGESSVGDDGVREGRPDANGSAESGSEDHGEAGVEQHAEAILERQKTVTRDGLVDTFA